jgi:DNA-binding CsgD family transcriptional regulator
MGGNDAVPLPRMTARELQTPSLLGERNEYRSIADELNVSYKTVVNTCAQLRVKFGADSKYELTRMACAPSKREPV